MRGRGISGYIGILYSPINRSVRIQQGAANIMRWKMARGAMAALVTLFLTRTVLGQSVADHAVQVSAAVQAEPPSIKLTWPGVDSVTRYLVSRRTADDPSWSDPIAVVGS